MAISHPSLWRPGTQQWIIAEALKAHGWNRKRAFAIEIRPRVGTEPLVFKGKRSDGSYGVLDHSDQCRRAWYRAGDVLKAIREHGWDPNEVPKPAEDLKPEPTSDDTGCGGCDNGEHCGWCDCCPKPEPIIVSDESQDVRSEAERYYREVRRLRDFVAARDGFDSLGSMRVVIDGVKAIKAGAPVDGLLAAIGATWQAESRNQARIPAFDYGAWKPRPDTFSHSTAEYVLALVRANVPVWLHGPAGTGKSSAAKHAAEQLGLDYYEVNLAGAMASAVKGKDRLKEFVESEFMRAYEHGGVCVLEEFDAAHPTVATAVNNAIANGEFHNDADGRSIKRHPDFRIVATANTLGTGATKEFNGRMKLDGATLDRFRVGRVYVGLDNGLERSIFESLLA